LFLLVAMLFHTPSLASWHMEPMPWTGRAQHHMWCGTPSSTGRLRRIRTRPEACSAPGTTPRGGLPKARIRRICPRRTLRRASPRSSGDRPSGGRAARATPTPRRRSPPSASWVALPKAGAAPPAAEVVAQADSSRMARSSARAPSRRVSFPTMASFPLRRTTSAAVVPVQGPAAALAAKRPVVVAWLRRVCRESPLGLPPVALLATLGVLADLVLGSTSRRTAADMGRIASTATCVLLGRSKGANRRNCSGDISRS